MQSHQLQLQDDDQAAAPPQESSSSSSSYSSSANKVSPSSAAAAAAGPSTSVANQLDDDDDHDDRGGWLRLGLGDYSYNPPPSSVPVATTTTTTNVDRQLTGDPIMPPAVPQNRRGGAGAGGAGGAGPGLLELGLNFNPDGNSGSSSSRALRLTATARVPSSFSIHAPPQLTLLPPPPPSLSGYNGTAAMMTTPAHQSQLGSQFWAPFGPVNTRMLNIPSPGGGGPSFVPGPFFMGLGQLPPVIGVSEEAAAAAGSSSSRIGSCDVRFVIDRPMRPHSGIWFRLLASPIQVKEPFLPQIVKSYLRIKDGRMTVGLLAKYLVNKLSLDNESQVEITCRGQQLAPSLTLQYVRDHIWRNSIIITDAQLQSRLRPRPQQPQPQPELVTLLPDSSTIDHLMVLHYCRSLFST